MLKFEDDANQMHVVYCSKTIWYICRARVPVPERDHDVWGSSHPAGKCCGYYRCMVRMDKGAKTAEV